MASPLLTSSAALSEAAAAIVASAAALQTPVDELPSIEFPIGCLAEIKEDKDAEEDKDVPPSGVIGETFQLHSPISPTTSISLSNFGDDASPAAPTEALINEQACEPEFVPPAFYPGHSVPYDILRRLPSREGPLLFGYNHQDFSIARAAGGDVLDLTPDSVDMSRYRPYPMGYEASYAQYTADMMKADAKGPAVRFTNRSISENGNGDITIGGGIPASPPPSDSFTESPIATTSIPFAGCFQADEGEAATVDGMQLFQHRQLRHKSDPNDTTETNTAANSGGEDDLFDESPVAEHRAAKRQRSTSDSFLHYGIMEGGMSIAGVPGTACMSLSPSPSSIALANVNSSITADIQRRRAKNTEAARRSRQKKSLKMRQLEDHCRELESRQQDIDRRYQDRVREKEECLAREAMLRERITTLERMVMESHELVVKLLGWSEGK